MLVALFYFLSFPLTPKWAEDKDALGARTFVCLFCVSDPDSMQKAGCLSTSCLSGASGSGNRGCVYWIERVL